MPDNTDLPAPRAPEPPRFDSTSETWLVSRYEEVEAALRDPAFRQASVDGHDTDVADDPHHPQLLSDLRADTERFVKPEWRAHMGRLARDLMNRAAGPAPVDLMARVIRPWSVTVGLQFSGADLAMRRRLGHIARRLSHTHDNPDVSTPFRKLAASGARIWHSWHHRRAEKELEHLVRSGKITIGRAFYASTTQTLPSFLAQAWLALLLHPEQMQLLRDEPERMPSAVEELLRYAGLVRSLHRRAAEDISLGNVSIAKGDFLALHMECANRDPSKYDEPHKLDLTRPRTGHIGLGVGPHACPGATIVRTVLALTTPVFIAARPRLAPGAAIQWAGDATVTWPSVIPVQLDRQA